MQGIEYIAVLVQIIKVRATQYGESAQPDTIIYIPFEGRFSVIGNFPYNISSPILFKILEWEPQVDEVIGMFQKEVALRIASRPGSKVYGILSVLMQAFFKVTYLLDVNENCFTPPPKVKSGVLKFTTVHNKFEIADKRRFIILVKAAFNQRRKTLRNALKSTVPAEMLSGPLMDKRAEQLAVADFVELYRQLLLHGKPVVLPESLSDLH